MKFTRNNLENVNKIKASQFQNITDFHNRFRVRFAFIIFKHKFDTYRAIERPKSVRITHKILNVSRLISITNLRIINKVHK